MKTLSVKVPHSSEYQIYIGSGLLEKFDDLIDLSSYDKIALFTDNNVSALWEHKLSATIKKKAQVIKLAPGEIYKNVDNASQVWKELLSAQFSRSSLLINLGGGVIGDLGGFIASTFMRGIDFIQIPSTLLAQVDASVGGKVGINHAGVKNSVGAFNQPRAVIIDVDTLSTLPQRELSSGMAEVIKHGLIADKTYFDKIHNLDIGQAQTSNWIDIVEQSCQIKTKVVCADEKESGLRKILNFGHTVGHALEAIFMQDSNSLLHGEAVSLGMLVAARISLIQNRISQQEFDQIEMVLEKMALPITVGRSIDLSVVIEKARSDKKNIDSQIKWTLLDGIGKASYDQEVPDSVVRQALEYIAK